MTGAALPLREQQAQILFALGVMHYQPYETRRVLGQSGITSEFDQAINDAKKRGFKGRRQLVGAARRGKATKFAMELMLELCSLFTEQEIAVRLARANAYAQWAATGRMPRGWERTSSAAEAAP